MARLHIHSVQACREDHCGKMSMPAASFTPHARLAQFRSWYCGCLHGPSFVARSRRRAAAVRASSAPDWDAEIETFRQRSLAPNQLETLRRAEEEDVDIGQVIGTAPLEQHTQAAVPRSSAFTCVKTGRGPGSGDCSYVVVRTGCVCDCMPWGTCSLQVLFSGEGLAIVEGLNNDAPTGTLLNFGSGPSGY